MEHKRVIEVIAGKGTNAVGSPFAEVRPPFFPWKAPIAGVVKALLLQRNREAARVPT
jgi:hypothetical protein